MKKITSNEDARPLATKITELRVRKALAKKEVGGISPSYMQKIENEGVIPSKTTLAKLASALGDGKTDLLKELIELAGLQKKSHARQLELPQASPGLTRTDPPSRTKAKLASTKKSRISETSDHSQQFTDSGNSNSRISRIYLARGQTKFKNRNFAGALDDCNKHIELSSKEVADFQFRALVKLKLDNLDGALDDCNQHIQLHPRDAGGYNVRALVRGKRGESVLAQADWDKIIELEKGHDQKNP